MSKYFLGRTQDDLLGDQPRYFYALRRTDDGELYFARVNQSSREDSVEINVPGDPEENYTDLEVGIDFFEGRNVNHDLVFDNLKYEQYRWENRSLYYYIDEEGQLVVRVDSKYNYPTGV